MAKIQRKYKHYYKTSYSKIVFCERKSKITFLNPERLSYDKVHVDGEEITEGLRCDYLLARYDVPKRGEYFIELKGSDVAHGIEQLDITMKQLSVNAENLDKYAFVIFAGNGPRPKLTSKIQKAKKDFKRQYKAHLVIERSGYEHNLY